jgi:hypothetical protein
MQKPMVLIFPLIMLIIVLLIILLIAMAFVLNQPPSTVHTATATTGDGP